MREPPGFRNLWLPLMREPPGLCNLRLPLMRELAAKLTEGEKKAVDNKYFSFLQCKLGLSLRQNLRFCHLPHQREAKAWHKIVTPSSEGGKGSA